MTMALVIGAVWTAVSLLVGAVYSFGRLRRRPMNLTTRVPGASRSYLADSEASLVVVDHNSQVSKAQKSALDVVTSSVVKTRTARDYGRNCTSSVSASVSASSGTRQSATTPPRTT
jgi:hypothetical protein